MGLRVPEGLLGPTLLLEELMPAGKGALGNKLACMGLVSHNSSLEGIHIRRGSYRFLPQSRLAQPWHVYFI